MSQIVKQTISVRSGKDRRSETATAVSSDIIEDSLVFMLQIDANKKMPLFRVREILYYHSRGYS